MGFFFLSLCYAFSFFGSITPSLLSASAGFLRVLFGAGLRLSLESVSFKAHPEFSQHRARGCCTREEQTAMDGSVCLTSSGPGHSSVYRVVFYSGWAVTIIYTICVKVHIFRNSLNRDVTSEAKLGLWYIL